MGSDRLRPSKETRACNKAKAIVDIKGASPIFSYHRHRVELTVECLLGPSIVSNDEIEAFPQRGYSSLAWWPEVVTSTEVGNWRYERMRVER